MRFWTLLVAITCALVLPAVPAQARTQSCGAGYVRLTFDDGPNRRATPEILDTLSAHGVTATFFVIGQMAAASPGIVRRESREGHDVGNHSWDQPPGTAAAARPGRPTPPPPTPGPPRTSPPGSGPRWSRSPSPPAP